MALTNNVFNTKTSSFNFGISPSASADYLSKNQNFKFSKKDLKDYSMRQDLMNNFGYTDTANLTNKQVKKAYNFENKLANNAKFASKHNTKVQNLSTKAQGLNNLKNTTPKQSEWSKGAEGKWGTALAGFDSVVNLTNAAMNWVNMGKQWDYMDKSMKLAQQQFDEEKARYDAREEERKTNNTNITNAFKAYYTNRANSSAMSADTNAAQAKAAQAQQAQNTQNPQNNAQNAQDNQSAQAEQDEERKPLPMERE